MEKLYHAGMDILRRLLDFVFPPRPSERLVRKADTLTLGALVSPVTIPSLPYPTTALLSYHNPLVQALIVELKFHKNKQAAALLGNVLREYVEELISDANTFERSTFLFVPIPLSKKRREARGYNQIELLWSAAELSSICSYAPTALSRIRETAPQTSLLGKERIENMQGAFRAEVLEPSHTYIVVDDVTTTGATMQAAVAALVSGGARNIVPLALAQ